MKPKIAKEAAKLTTCDNCGNKPAHCKRCYDFNHFKGRQSLLSFEPAEPTLMCNARGKMVKLSRCLNDCIIQECLNTQAVVDAQKGMVTA